MTDVTICADVTLKIVKKENTNFWTCLMSCVTLIIGILVSLRLIIMENLSGVALIIALRLLESEEYLNSRSGYFDNPKLKLKL